MPSFHTSPLWARDAGGRGASERHRRAGDAPPSPWPPKGLVSGLERLYGPVSRWQRVAIMGPLRSEIFQPLRNLCLWPRLRGPVVSEAAMLVRSARTSGVANPSPETWRRGCGMKAQAAEGGAPYFRDTLSASRRLQVSITVFGVVLLSHGASICHF